MISADADLSRGARLLELIHRVVRSQPATPLIRGRIALVVRGADDDAIWCAEFGDDHVACGFVPELGFEPDALLVLDERAAGSILDGGAPEEASIERAGDGALLERFIDHYLTVRSSIDVRAARPEKEKRRKRRP